MKQTIKAFINKLVEAAHLTPPEKPSKLYTITVYVRDQRTSAPTTEEVLAVAMAINARPLRYSGIEAPTEGILSERQYAILPEAVKRLFVKKTLTLQTV